MPATKTRKTTSTDPMSQFRSGIDSLAQHLRNRRGTTD